jgi:hypothetical protein
MEYSFSADFFFVCASRSGSSSADPEADSSSDGGSVLDGCFGGDGGTDALDLVAFGEEGGFFEAFGEEDFFDLGEGIVAEATCSSSDSSSITLLRFFAGSEGLLFSSRQCQKCSGVRFATSARFGLLETSASPFSSLFASAIISL